MVHFRWLSGHYLELGKDGDVFESRNIFLLFHSSPTFSPFSPLLFLLSFPTIFFLFCSNCINLFTFKIWYKMCVVSSKLLYFHSSTRSNRSNRSNTTRTSVFHISAGYNSFSNGYCDTGFIWYNPYSGSYSL